MAMVKMPTARKTGKVWEFFPSFQQRLELSSNYVMGSFFGLMILFKNRLCLFIIKISMSSVIAKMSSSSSFDSSPFILFLFMLVLVLVLVYVLVLVFIVCMIHLPQFLVEHETNFGN